MATEKFEDSFIYKAFLTDGWNIDNCYEHEFKNSKSNEIKAQGLGIDISKSPVNPYLEFHASIFLEDIQYDNEMHLYDFGNWSKIVDDVNKFYDVFNNNYLDEAAKAVIQGCGNEVTISDRDFFPHIENPEKFGGHHAGHIYLRDPIVAYIDSHYNYVSTHSISEIVNDIKAIDKDSCLDKLISLKDNIPKQSKENIQKDVQSR